MGRLIDADAAIAAASEPSYYDLTDVPLFLEEQPTVDAAPVVHGDWENVLYTMGWDIDGKVFRCTICKEMLDIDVGTPDDNGYKYCPYCGAKMDAE